MVHIDWKWTACLALLLVFGMGCKRKAQTPTPPAAVEYDAGPDLALAVEGGEVHITPENESSAPVVDLPQDVPIFSDAKVSLAASSPRGEFLTFTADGSPASTVREFYVNELAAREWDLTSQRNTETTHELSAAKAGRTLHVLIDATDGGAEVTLSHQRASASS